MIAGSTSYKKTPPRNAPKPKPPSRVPLVTTGPSIDITPLELLLWLGVAMLPPRHVEENLAPWHWSLLRYAHLIDRVPAPGDPFALNELVGDYRYHNMIGLSEAVGVGCA